MIASFRHFVSFSSKTKSFGAYMWLRVFVCLAFV